MEKLQTTGTYEEFKEALHTELQKNVDSFVKIGYLLKLARDTDILYKSGYRNVTEFAAAEYGLTKDVVSRYIAINDRYSVDGYGEQLKEEYRAFGVAKLAEMLTLSDEVIQSLSPELTRKEIQEVKREIKEEEKITDMEVMLESTPESPEFDTLAAETLYQYLKENKEEFKKIHLVIEKGGETEEVTEKLLDVIAPSGIAAKTVRIPGKGKIMISIKGKDEKVDFLNVRTNEKESHDWESIIAAIDAMLKFTDYQGDAEQTKVAPVQPESKAAETIEPKEKQPEIEPEQPGVKTEQPESELEEQEVESVTGEVERDLELEELKEALAEAFIKRYSTRLEYSENMKDEIYTILDRVHRSQWILQHKEKEYFVVEEAGYIKLRQGEEIITTLYWSDFYELMYKVYWKEKENYTPPMADKSCTGATEEALPGQMEVGDYPEILPEGTESNYDKWLKKKPEVETRVDNIRKAILTDDYAAVERQIRRLAELMEE